MDWISSFHASWATCSAQAGWEGVLQAHERALQSLNTILPSVLKMMTRARKGTGGALEVEWGCKNMTRGRREASSASYSCERNSGAMAPGLLSCSYTLKLLIIIAGRCLPTAHVGQWKIFREGGRRLSSGSTGLRVPQLRAAWPGHHFVGETHHSPATRRILRTCPG